MQAAEVVKRFFAALDAGDWRVAERYLSDQYMMVGFTDQQLGKEARLQFVRLLRSGLPNLQHSLSNISTDENIVRVTVQLSGIHSADLDLRSMGYGLIPRTQKFIIFPNATMELTVAGDKILTERDVSPQSPNRRMPGLLKALGVNMIGL